MSTKHTFIWHFTPKDITYPKSPKALQGDESFLEEFYIGTFHTIEWRKIKFKGTFQGFPSWLIQIVTKEEVHSIYGTTYDVEDYSLVIPQDKETILKFLEKVCKVTERQAEKLYKACEKEGFEWQEILEQMPYHIPWWVFREDRKKEEFRELLLQKVEFLEEQSVLASYDIFKPLEIDRLVKYFRPQETYKNGVKELIYSRWVPRHINNVIEAIALTPYILMLTPWISFKKADSLYLQLFPEGRLSEERIFASLWSVLGDACYNYHLSFLYEDEVVDSINRSLWIQLSEREIFDHLERRNIKWDSCISTITRINWEELELLMDVFERLVIYNGQQWGRVVYLEEIHKFEQWSAEWVVLQLIENNIPERILKKKDLSEDVTWITLNEDQKSALKQVYRNSLSIIYGYGGTGKSTILKQLLRLELEQKWRPYFLGPTWKSVDVLVKSIGEPNRCFTAHKFLWLLPSINWWVHQCGKWMMETSNPTLLVIDESSMIDLPLFYYLIKGIVENEKTRVVFIWDNNQLPPIWLWRPFLDLLEVDQIEKIRLTKIYRQKEDSLILERSKLVAEALDYPDECYFDIHQEGSDWKTFDSDRLLWERDVHELVLQRIKDNEWSDKDVVLTPTNKWLCWVKSLNQSIQQLLQDNKTIKFQGSKDRTYYIGEKVIQTGHNWYRSKKIWETEVTLLDEKLKELNKQLEDKQFEKKEAEENADKKPLETELQEKVISILEEIREIEWEIIEVKKLVLEQNKYVEFFLPKTPGEQLDLAWKEYKNLVPKFFYYPTSCYSRKNLKLLKEILKDNWYKEEHLFARIAYFPYTKQFVLGNNVVAIYDEETKTIKKDEWEYKDKIVFPDVYNGNWWKVIAVKVKRYKDDPGVWYDENGMMDIDVIPSGIGKESYEAVVLVDFDDKIIWYPEEELEYLDLFYASTVHKSQWSQFRRVYALALPKDKRMLTRTLLYTMLSRAQDYIEYFSTQELTEQAKANNTSENKRTALKLFIQRQLMLASDWVTE